LIIVRNKNTNISLYKAKEAGAHLIKYIDSQMLSVGPELPIVKPYATRFLIGCRFVSKVDSIRSSKIKDTRQ
jgi:hypothetical protein